MSREFAGAGGQATLLRRQLFEESRRPP